MRQVETESSDDDYGDEVIMPKTRTQKELAKKGGVAAPISDS